jgi:hypothetical protein
MKKIIIHLIETILVELGLIITIGLMSLVTALYYDTHPILCSVTTITGIITIILTFWYTYDIVLLFEILILHIQGYIDGLILRRLLMQYIKETDDSKTIDEKIAEIEDKYLYK